MIIGSLFTGYGGLDMAVEEHFGARTVWCSDIDLGACKIIAHRMPGIPNLGDITRIDWATVERVDILAGGWPCQPFSLAGKRKGAADERALWPFVAGAVRALRPRHVVLENVAAIASAGELARATADLSALGYDAQWTCLRAADVGAPHGRARIFIVATDTNDRAADGQRPRAQPRGRGVATDSERLGQSGRRRLRDVGGAASDSAGEALQRQRDRHAADDRGATPANANEPGPQGPESTRRRDLPTGSAAADPASDGRREGWPESARLVGGSDAAQRGDAAADTDRGRRSHRAGSAEVLQGRERQPDRGGAGTPPRRVASAYPEVGWARPGEAVEAECPQDQREPCDTAPLDIAWGAYEPAIRRWERRLGRPTPAPTETSPKGSQRLSARFVEWMQGLPEGWVCDVPGLTRNEQLKALGNGVVPQQALAALRLLTELQAVAS